MKAKRSKTPNDNQMIGRMKNAFTTSLKESLRCVADDHVEDVWDEWEKVLQADLKDSNCWLSFNDAITTALVGIGAEGSAAHSIKPEISIDTYDDVAVQWPAQIEDMHGQIKGIDAFMAELADARKQLSDAISRTKQKPKAK